MRTTPTRRLEIPSPLFFRTPSNHPISRIAPHLLRPKIGGSSCPIWSSPSAQSLFAAIHCSVENPSAWATAELSWMSAPDRLTLAKTLPAWQSVGEAVVPGKRVQVVRRLNVQAADDQPFCRSQGHAVAGSHAVTPLAADNDRLQKELSQLIQRIILAEDQGQECSEQNMVISGK